jgi:hypothetical protein
MDRFIMLTFGLIGQVEVLEENMRSIILAYHFDQRLLILVLIQPKH